MRRSFVGTLLFAFLALTTSPANAFICDSSSACPAYQRDSLVFRGRVLSLTAAPQSLQPTIFFVEGPSQLAWIRFQVLEAFKGEPGVEVTILGDPKLYTAGNEYLVYASLDSRNHVPAAERCPSHQLVSNRNLPDPDLETLRALVGAHGNGVLAGRLYLTSDSFPTADIPISLTGASSTATTAEPNGSYHELFFLFKDLMPGDYVIAAKPPAGIVVTPGIWPRPQTNPTTLRVESNSCNEVNWALRYDSHIRGRVTDTSGQPVANADVALISHRYPDQIARGRFAASKRVKTDANGNYDLSELDPGEYVVALHSNPPSDASPYAPVFYPSKQFAWEAEVLHMDAAASRNNIDLVQSDPLQPVTAHVVVNRAAGTPIENALVIATDPGSALQVVSARTDSSGHADLHLFSGRQYSIVASTPDPNGQKQESPQCAGPVAFVASNNLSLPPLVPDKTFSSCRSASPLIPKP